MVTLFIIKPGFEQYKSKLEEFFYGIWKIQWTEVGEFRYTEEFLEEFYAEHKEKPWFPELVSAFTGKKGILVVLQTDKKEKANIFGWVRDLLGSTDPQYAEVGSIRNRYGKNIMENVAHSSAKQEDFSREIAVLQKYFPDLNYGAFVVE